MPLRIVSENGSTNMKDNTVKVLNIAAIICTVAITAFMALLIGVNMA